MERLLIGVINACLDQNEVKPYRPGDNCRHTGRDGVHILMSDRWGRDVEKHEMPSASWIDDRDSGI